jgi:hypothetical protein
MSDLALGARHVEQRERQSERADGPRAAGELRVDRRVDLDVAAGPRALEPIRLESPEEDADVRDVVSAAAVVDVPHVDRVRRRLEGSAEQLERRRVADVERAAVGGPYVVHVSRRDEALEELDRAGGPAGEVVCQLLEHRRGPLASPVRERVGDERPLTERSGTERQQPSNAQQVADVGDDPLLARLDEPVVVQLLDVGLEEVDVARDDAQQGAQLVLLRLIAHPVDGREQVVQPVALGGVHAGLGVTAVRRIPTGFTSSSRCQNGVVVGWKSVERTLRGCSVGPGAGSTRVR